MFLSDRFEFLRRRIGIIGDVDDERVFGFAANLAWAVHEPVKFLDELDQLTVDGTPVNLAGLESQLEGEARHRAILLLADRDASYGKAVSIFDRLEKLGFHRVALGTTPERL